ncbi:MAG: UbiA family prenyltransferase [gamma proteobacterium endosymbiont of Lamellibrachia anaximandri]|nr:UbiA family prenyltransferase [gamma proteobacterium endosymbiont of Lamellibrachia anaximandri]MBL3534786.1 UbiA family prenyltransferase [gamma proteobacterium endosymbiont of Lamellibrachia anaximandri]MBL3600773.1 UbiA family prenyltransferase [gamma proteobacterium endosymbiont of Lamellibrachia anaximandri]
MNTTQHHPLIDYLQLVRAPAVFTALSNILAAHLIITQGEIAWPQLLLLLGSTAALYTAGMALNDWFDYSIDLQERPQRPLPSGRIERQNALFLGLELLVIGIGLAAYANIQSMFIAIIIALLVLLYDGLLKRTLLGSLNMGGCRYFNWLLGFSFLPLTGDLLIIALPVFIYITALTLLSREEEQARHRWVLILTAAGITAAGLLIVLLAPAPIQEHPLLALGIVAGLFTVSRQLLITYHDFTPARVAATIKLLLFGIILLDALLVLAFGPWWGALAVLSLMLPGKLLARFMYVT